MYFLGHLELELELELELGLELGLLLESKLVLKLPRVANAELLAEVVEDTYCMR